MLKKIRIQIITDRYDINGSLYALREGEAICAVPARDGEIEHTETTVEGRYHDDGIRISIGYKESALSGMEGSSTTLSFHKTEPGSISMLRTGEVKTALYFEQGRQHTCVYQTPIMPFDVCVLTHKVDNRLEDEGILELAYTVELRGAQAQHTQLRLRLLPQYDRPQQ